MLQRQVPHREGLELGITGTLATTVFVVKLTQTYCHLAAARTRSGNDDQLARGFYKVVLAVAFITGNELYIVRIALDGVMNISLDAHALEAMTELVGCHLSVIVGDDD